MRIRGGIVRTIACAVVVAALALAGCSSSSNGGQASQDCPFTGTMNTTSGGSSSLGQQAVTGIVTSKQGCVDNIQMTLGAGVGPWSIAYASGPVLDANGAAVATNSDTNLVVTFSNAAWKGAGSSPTTILPIQLVHVKSINVVPGPNATLLIVYGLDTKRPYQASDSETPAYVSLGIG